MCRLFALRANLPTRLYGSLVGEPHSLRRQSCCDARQICHDSGWGIGYYIDGHIRRTRSPSPANEDPGYLETAEGMVTTTALAHVRRASMGTVAEKNTHPFIHQRWLFAHNGTLINFPAVQERMRQMIPGPLRSCIEGETDSEHAFFLLLARLEAHSGSLAVPPSPAALCQALVDTIHTLEELCPGTPAERSEYNFVLTDGQVLVATRWGHSLAWCERRGHDPAVLDKPLTQTPDYHALVIGSEPSTAEAWSEVPDRSLLCINADLTHALKPIA